MIARTPDGLAPINRSRATVNSHRTQGAPPQTSIGHQSPVRKELLVRFSQCVDPASAAHRAATRGLHGLRKLATCRRLRSVDGRVVQLGRQPGATVATLRARGGPVTGVPPNRIAIGWAIGPRRGEAEAPRSAGTAPSVHAYESKLTCCCGPCDSRGNDHPFRTASASRITRC
jgi:hypothetical protein